VTANCLLHIAREELIGFYSSGPKIKENDLKVTLNAGDLCVSVGMFLRHGKFSLNR
jgi:hypothetical protein